MTTALLPRAALRLATFGLFALSIAACSKDPANTPDDGALTPDLAMSDGATIDASGDGGTIPNNTSCTAPTFITAVATWVDLDVAPAAGTQGIRDALNSARDDHPNEAVRIRLAPGTYADNLGGEIYAQRLLRTSAAPIYVVATNPAPNATVIGQGINLVGVSYLAIDGITIGPATVGAWSGSTHAAPQPLQAQAGIHISGAAKNGNANAKQSASQLDTSIYGQYEPSHHLLIQNVTIQNVFGADAESALTDEGQSMDGIKLNQAEDVWVLNSTVRQTSRHGVDNVGVHRAAYCGLTVVETGGGLGIEAKGGSVDVLYENNVFVNVRRVELGGENTDATYYFSVDGAYDYEAKHTVARNNAIIDAREAALEFSGCVECAAINNSILFSTAYVVPGAVGANATGGDAIRVHDSLLLGAADGAGSDCTTWDEGQMDYVGVDNCWQVGSHAPAPIGRTLVTKNARLYNNVFLSANGTWSTAGGGGGSTIPCPLNAASSDALTMDYNYWWNGTRALPTDGCLALPEGGHSTASTASAAADPKVGTLTVGGATVTALYSAAVGALSPVTGSPLLGAGLANVTDGVAVDLVGTSRPAAWSIGAFEHAP